MNSTEFLDRATRILFFTGKGGVGNVAGLRDANCAGRRREDLPCQYDPASNLDEVLGVRLSGEAAEVPGSRGFCALNIDPEIAAQGTVHVARPRGVLPKAALAAWRNSYPGHARSRSLRFDQFSKLLGDPATTAGFDHVIFDTAPTGHTLRLLQLPAA